MSSDPVIVGPPRFLNWMYPGRELRQLQQKLDNLRTQALKV